MIPRRALLQNAIALPLNLISRAPRLEVGIMDVILGFASDPEAFAAAERIGFDAIQVTLGKPDAEGKLLLADAALQQRILQSSTITDGQRT